jgi:hypothetical protein
MRRAHAHLLAVIGVLAAATVGCGGGAEEGAPAAAPPPPAPVATTDIAPPPPPAETAATPAPPPPPEVPASYLAAQSAESAQVGKLVDLLKDEKAAPPKLADSLTKFAKDPEGAKAVQAYHAERAKLTDEQKAEADKKAAPDDVQAKVDGAGPSVEKCKKDKKCNDALTKAIASFSAQAAAPAGGDKKPPAGDKSMGGDKKPPAGDKSMGGDKKPPAGDKSEGAKPKK